MNTETLSPVDTSATTQTPADEQLSALQNEDQTQDATPKDGDEKANPADLDKTIRKLQRRIDNRTRGLGERDAEIAHLRRQLAERESQRSDEPQGETQLSEADVETRARQLAADRVYSEGISSKTQAMLKAAKAIDGFQGIAAEVAQEIPFLDRSGKPTPFIEDILDRAPEMAARLLEQIGSDPELLADLAEMNERQRTRRLALLETELEKKPEQRSKAAKPIAPLNGVSRGDPDPESNPRAWIEARNKKLRTG